MAVASTPRGTSANCSPGTGSRSPCPDRANAHDNAVAESFFATLKEELLYRGVWPTRDAARRAVFEYIEVFYNRQRMHSSLDYLTPVEYEARTQGRNKALAA
ncbi:MAG: IS3 family transposase [Acidobacteriota bacterium]|nr:IS3 family transposase [Acidobacteriota bacterium]